MKSQALYETLWQAGQGREEDIVLRCGDTSLSYGALFQGLLQAEAGLRALGVGPGELVTLFSLNTPEAVMAFYAIDRIGAVANWVDMKVSPAEVEEYLTQAGSRVALVLEVAFSKVYHHRGKAPTQHFVVLPLAPYVAPELEGKLHLSTWQQGAGPDCLSWADFLRPPAQVPPEADRWEEPVAITYTGGTTGPAKGVVLSRRSFAWALEYYTRAETEYGRGGFALVLLPLFAVFGLSQCLHTPLSLGMGVILCPMFRPHDLGEMLRRYRPEQVCGTTAYWQFLLQDAWTAEADLSFLEVPRCGGDVLPAELERRINAFLAQRGCASRLIKEYGMSEDGGIMCVSYGAWEDGDVGRPLPGCRVVAVDPETGALCPPEVQGELLIQSQAVMNGYYRRPEADHQVLKPGPDGTLWVWTKDLGHLTADGRVVVTGRKKRMLSRNGFKIFPSVIENCFLEDPQVTACAVVGGKNREGETVPVAYVVPRQGTDPRELEQALRTRAKKTLNTYLIPAAYHFLAELPLTPRGKLDYRTLEAWAAEQEEHP